MKYVIEEKNQTTRFFNTLTSALIHIELRRVTNRDGNITLKRSV